MKPQLASVVRLGFQPDPMSYESIVFVVLRSILDICCHLLERIAQLFMKDDSIISFWIYTNP